MTKARQGITTLDEVLRVTPSDMQVDGCPACGPLVDDDFDSCPWCAADLGAEERRSCGRELQFGWTVRPRCATPTPTPDAPASAAPQG